MIREPLPFKGKIWYVHAYPITHIRHNSDNLVHTPKFLAKLKKSITELGIQNPLIGRMVRGKVQVGPGKQRLRAAIELDLTHVPIMIWDQEGTLPNLQWGAVRIAPDAVLIESYFTDDHEVDMESLRRGWLAIKKTINWRDKREL